MGANVLVSLKAAFEYMRSSSMFDSRERKTYSMIADALQALTGQDAEFMEVRDVQWTEYGGSGGILRLIDDPTILAAWRRIWLIVGNANPELEKSSEIPALKSYLWMCSSASTAIGPDYRLSPKSAPNLSAISDWNAPIDDVLAQRYDKQLSLLMINVKRLLDLCRHPQKSEAQQLLDLVAPNIDNGSAFSHYIRADLFKLQHAIDLKSSFYFDVQFGDHAPIVLKRSLLLDVDLKTEMVAILKKLSSSDKSNAVYDLVIRLLIIGGFKSVLNYCLKRAKLDPSQVNPTPLRSKLKIMQSSSK